jgi:hypothetical protein
MLTHKSLVLVFSFALWMFFKVAVMQARKESWKLNDAQYYRALWMLWGATRTPPPLLRVLQQLWELLTNLSQIPGIVLSQKCHEN